MCETNHEPPPAPYHLFIINLSGPNLGFQTHENQKELGIDYRLGVHELPHSVSEGLLLYRQQYDSMHCC